MAIALAISTSSATAADFDAEQAIQGLVVSGVVESWNGYSFRSGDDGNFSPDEQDHFVSGIDGMLSLPLGNNFSIQTDVALEYTDKAWDNSNSDDTYQYGSQFGTHFTYRNPDSFAIGAFGAFGRGNVEEQRVDSYAVGGEAQFYLNDLTFYLQGGVMDARGGDNDEDAFHNAVFARGVGRWHISPDSRLQAEFAYANGDQDTDNQDMDIFEWGVRYDMVLAGLPLIGDTQLFVGYRGTDVDNGTPVADNGAFTEHTVLIGTSHSFGGSTMKEVERFGAGLDLPDFMRWATYGNTVD